MDIDKFKGDFQNPEVHELPRYSDENLVPVKNKTLGRDKSSEENKNSTFPIIMINEEETIMMEVGVQLF